MILSCFSRNISTFLVVQSAHTLPKRSPHEDIGIENDHPIFLRLGERKLSFAGATS